MIRILFLMCLDIMKQILNLGEFKLGKKSADYKYFKREVMNCFYNTIKKTCIELKNKKILQFCECKAKLRHGYSTCKICGGCGYKIIDKKDK